MLAQKYETTRNLSGNNDASSDAKIPKITVARMFILEFFLELGTTEGTPAILRTTTKHIYTYEAIASNQ